MSVLFSPRFQAVDANGRPYPGAQLFFYQAGTSSLITTYQDAGATTPSLVNSDGAVVADAAGAFPPIFLTTNPFKFVLKTSAGSVLDGADDIPLNDAAALLTDFQISDSALITKVDATAGAGPELDLYRNSASPAAADALGLIKFTGKDSAGNTTTYASIEAILADPTNATEDGTLLIKLMLGGTLTTRATINASGWALPALTLTTALPETSGGTGQATYTAGDLLYASATNTLSKLAKGAPLSKLRMNAGATAPEWSSDTASNPGAIYGLTLSNNASDATNDIDIAAGVAADSNNAVTMTLVSGLTKRLDAAWAVGSGNGFLDTGSIANTTYHIFLIQRSDTGVVDAIASTSATAPTMPANYDVKRRIGSIIRASSAIVAFYQYGDEFYLKERNTEQNGAAPATTAQTLALRVPTGLTIKARVLVGLRRVNGSGLYYLLVTPLTETDSTPSSSIYTVAALAETDRANASTEIGVMTNTSGQIRWRSTSASVSELIDIWTIGWTDTRGRLG